MQKDVIYIDAEDDITAIIGKIKASKEKIIALVPPKRAGVLQSAVNLRLLDRMAKTSKKKLVLITNNQALIALSATAHIPVAKNLQSKPELAEITALSVDDDDDIIDGAELPVGDHAKSTKSSKSNGHNVGDHVALSNKPSRNDVVDTLAIDDEAIDLDTPSDDGDRPVRKQASKSKVKIPNFSSFRKRLALIITGVVALVGLLVWMFVFAPSATIIVTANTTSAPVSATVKLGGTAATDFQTGVVRSVTQELKKDEVVEFDATGTGKVGEKATGTITIENCDGPAFTIPANTTFTANTGQKYVSSSSISVGELDGSASLCRASGAGAGTGTGSVTALEVGSEYNLSAKVRSYSISGVSGDIYASGSAMTGGSSREVKVVSAEDVERARGQVIGQSTDDVKKELADKFTNGEKVISSSFTVTRAEPVSAPAVGAEVADGAKAKLTINTTYTMYAFPKADLETYLNESLKQQIGDDESSQRIYDNGIDGVGLSNFINNEQGITVTVTADGQIGPKIDESALKDQVKGKITGDVQAALNDIDGISDINVEYSYFWVRSVPNNPNKIVIEFKLENDEE